MSDAIISQWVVLLLTICMISLWSLGALLCLATNSKVSYCATLAVLFMLIMFTRYNTTCLEGLFGDCVVCPHYTVLMMCDYNPGFLDDVVFAMIHVIAVLPAVIGIPVLCLKKSNPNPR